MKSSYCTIVGLAILAATGLILPSCSGSSNEKVEREKLFTLSYGRFEDEIDLFRLDSSSMGPDTQIFMRDGVFYISNSGSKKIIQLTSFGDLLSVFYNPEVNPVPSFADKSGAMGESAGSTTRKAVAYPFNHPVFLTVDSLKRLFVADPVPPERYEFDNDEQVILRDVVLRFDEDGRFIDYLGQEGPGGTPFPPISGVFSNSANEIIVTAKSQVGVRVYWFDTDGNLLYRIPVSYRNLPSPYDADTVVFSSLEKIIPDPASRRIYLKIDYYRDVIDESTSSNAGIAFNRSCVYPFDIDSEKYLDRIDISSYEGVDKDRQGTLTFKKPFELLGITSTGWLFLATPVPEGYALELMDSRSRRTQKRILPIQDDELAYNALMLSSDGILSALLATQYNASVVWWRTDSLIGEIRR